MLEISAEGGESPTLAFSDIDGNQLSNITVDANIVKVSVPVTAANIFLPSGDSMESLRATINALEQRVDALTPPPSMPPSPAVPPPSSPPLPPSVFLDGESNCGWSLEQSYWFADSTQGTVAAGCAASYGCMGYYCTPSGGDCYAHAHTGAYTCVSCGSRAADDLCATASWASGYVGYKKASLDGYKLGRANWAVSGSSQVSNRFTGAGAFENAIDRCRTMVHGQRLHGRLLRVGRRKLSGRARWHGLVADLQWVHGLGEAVTVESVYIGWEKL
ncbi:hypothetical protein OAO87_04395 [bacterium]|nr:hypothetical protein [bacterium]